MQNWVCVPTTGPSLTPTPTPILISLYLLSLFPCLSSLPSVPHLAFSLPPIPVLQILPIPGFQLSPETLLHIPITLDNTVSITMELADKAIGFLFSILSLSIFTYYTFWVIILPFVESDHFIHRYFLPQEFAILIPVFAGMALLSLLCIFVGFVMLKSKKKKA